MKIQILRNVEYAEALKKAIELRRLGRITKSENDQLGIFLYNVAKWAIAHSIENGKLWFSFAKDYDFQMSITATVIDYADRVDLDRKPKEILVYLFRVARSAIRDMVKKATAGKRQHEECEIESATLSTDFYGRICGLAFDNDIMKNSPKNRRKP